MACNEQVNSINFRSGDFWQDAAADFNTVLTKFEELRQENEALKAELKQDQEVEV